jgi:hypothetical protein
MLIRVCGQRDRSGLEECAFEVVDQVSRILNANAETDEVLRKATSGTCCRINGRMPRREKNKKMRDPSTPNGLTTSRRAC